MLIVRNREIKYSGETPAIITSCETLCNCENLWRIAVGRGERIRTSDLLVPNQAR